MNNDTLDEKIITIEERFRESCCLIKLKGRDILSNYDITTPQFNALNYLVFEGEMTIGELSSKMFLACSTVTDLLDRMERNDLVKRVKDSKDRRVSRLVVLEKGHSIIEDVLDNRRTYLKEIFSELEDDKIDMIYETFNIVDRCMRETMIE